MREVVLDTETTGLDPGSGHRIVEIGCVELLNHVPTGRTFQCYVNPERSMPAEAFAVHGLSSVFLADKPPFAEIVEGFCTFVGCSLLVIHNAAFDLGFLNAELQRLDQSALPSERVIDTVQLARRKYPGAPASLDALCRRFQIDNSDRVQHGALKDAELLARVYLELRGGREPGLGLVSAVTRRLPGLAPARWTPKIVLPTADEEAAHGAFVSAIPDAVWATRAAVPGASEELSISGSAA